MTLESPFEQNALFPWQIQDWYKTFTLYANNGHFPHAILLSGMPGIGKKALAFYLAKGLLCQSPQENTKTNQIEPCHTCRSCQLFYSGNHPDVFYLTIPEEKKIIPVDLVRELIQWSSLSRQIAHRKVIIVEPADAMNINASNSLLKTLEEPVADTHFVLVTDKKQALLPTIRSRCHMADLMIPDQQIAWQWLSEQLQDNEHLTSHPVAQQTQILLSLANGSPLRAFDLSTNEQLANRQMIIENLLSIIFDDADPISIAETLAKSSQVKTTSRVKSAKKLMTLTVFDVLYWIDLVVMDVIKLLQHCATHLMINSDYETQLVNLSKHMKLIDLLNLSGKINKAYSDIQGQININLLIENLLIDWQNCKA